MSGANGCNNPQLTLAWFETSTPLKGEPAYGTQGSMSWDNFVSIISIERRVGEKDGLAFVPSKFRPEPDGRVRRKLDRVQARTAVALDVETNTKTGEVLPPPSDTVLRIQAIGLAAAIYTSHNHRTEAPRYRIVSPLETEIAADIPAPGIVAERLGLRGVMDMSKRHAASLFFTPSAASHAALAKHETIVIPGDPVGQWLTDAAATLKAEQDRIAAEAQKAAVDRLAAKIAAGFDPTSSIVEAIRQRLPDLDHILRTHGYDKSANKAYRHPASESGSFGLTIRTFSGVERAFSHNATDPLHADNLPHWCGVTAVDSFDVVTILDFNGNRDRAIRDLAKRYELTKTPAKRAVARLIFTMVRRQATQEEIEASAISAGYIHGLTRDEVIAVSHWVASQLEAA